VSEAAPPCRRLLLSALTNWLAFAATLLVSFFLTPYLVRVLGAEVYGVWVFAESILAYFTLFDLGIAASVVRFVARFHTQGSRAELNRLCSSCLALFLGLGGLVFVIAAALASVLVSGVTADSGLDHTEVATFLWLMLANLAVTLPLSIFPSILDGLERFTAKSLVRIVFLAIRTAGIVVLMEHRAGLVGLGILYTVCNLLEHGVLAGLSFRCLPGLRFSWRLIDRPTLRLVRGYSLDAFLAMVAGRISVQSGPIVIGLMLTAAHIAWFRMALQLVEFAKALLRTATTTLTPVISSLESAGDMEAIRRIFLRGTRWVLYLILPVQLGLIVFGRPFLRIWIGPDLAERSYPTLVILSATLSLVLAQSVAARVLYGMGRLRLFARMTLVEAVVNLTLSILLVRGMGIEGVALAAALPNLALCLFVIGYTARLLRVSPRTYLTGCWLKPLAAVMVPTALWLGVSMPLRGWFDFGAAILVGLVPYAVVVLTAEGHLERMFIRAWMLLRGVAKRRTVSSSTVG
jgi:O-antigen/teichoic acid export membrane protein